MGVGGQRHASVALPPAKTRYPFYRRLGGPQGRSGRVWKISPPRRDSIPGPSSPLRVAIQTELSQPTRIYWKIQIKYHVMNTYRGEWRCKTINNFMFLFSLFLPAVCQSGLAPKLLSGTPQPHQQFIWRNYVPNSWLSEASRRALGPIQSPILWVTGKDLPWVSGGRGVRLRTHLQLIPRIRMGEDISPSPQYALLLPSSFSFIGCTTVQCSPSPP